MPTSTCSYEAVQGGNCPIVSNPALTVMKLFGMMTLCGSKYDYWASVLLLCMYFFHTLYLPLAPLHDIVSCAYLYDIHIFNQQSSNLLPGIDWLL